MDEPEKQALLLEDNLMVSTALVPQLRAAGYRVATRASAEGLMELLSTSCPALLVINLTSRRFDAAAVIQEIRAAGFAQLPILAYAGHVEREILHAGREAGATLVAPNSAVRSALPQVLEKLARVVEQGASRPAEF